MHRGYALTTRPTTRPETRPPLSSGRTGECYARPFANSPTEPEKSIRASPGESGESVLSCPRCGAQLSTLADCVEIALRLADRATEARVALDRMRLALPSSVGACITETRLDAATLARRLLCHAGTCTPTTKSQP